MTFDTLQPIMQSISAISDFTTLILNIKELKTKISGKTLQDIQKDNVTIEDILTECFIRKEVLWQKPNSENLYWCINSLTDLQSKCNDYTSKFITPNDDRKYFYSQLMRLWGNSCNETYKELYRHKDEINYDLYKPLKKLRQHCYKIIGVFYQLLPDGNLIRQEALKKLEEGCKNTKLLIKQILPEWTIE